MIRYLRTFVVAAETSSFSATGARLGLTQSAVSTQIRRLEEDLDCQLFERNGKSVTVSEAGQRLLPEAMQLLDLFNRMKGAGNRSDSRPIDIGAISTVQMTLFPKALLRFRQDFPDVRVNIVPGVSAQLLMQVDARELDIAVIIKPRLGIPSDLRWIPLMQETFVVILPTGLSLPLNELPRTLPFVRYTRTSHGGQMVDRYLKQNNLPVQDSIELDEPLVIMNVVGEGLGWSILPGELIPLSTTPTVRVLPLPGRPPTREIGIIVRVSSLKRPSVSAFIDSMTTEVDDFRQRNRLEFDTTACTSWKAAEK